MFKQTEDFKNINDEQSIKIIIFSIKQRKHV